MTELGQAERPDVPTDAAIPLATVFVALPLMIREIVPWPMIA